MPATLPFSNTTRRHTREDPSPTNFPHSERSVKLLPSGPGASTQLVFSSQTSPAPAVEADVLNAISARTANPRKMKLPCFT